MCDNACCYSSQVFDCVYAEALRLTDGLGCALVFMSIVVTADCERDPLVPNLVCSRRY